MWKSILLLSLALLSGAATADAYKCRLPNGQIEFSNRPCASGKPLAVRPDEKVSEAERKQAEEELERARAYLERVEAQQQAEAAAARERLKEAAAQPKTNNGPTQAERNTEACLKLLDQLALDPALRAQREAQCRGENVPQNVCVPYPVVVPGHRGNNSPIIQQPTHDAPHSHRQESTTPTPASGGNVVKTWKN